jgi:hypothetical protein
MTAKITRRNLLEVASTGGAAFAVAATAAMQGFRPGAIPSIPTDKSIMMPWI